MTLFSGEPFLLSKIHFKPPVIETLAREAGIEPGVLDLLRRFGLTSEAELKDRLGIMDDALQPEPKPEDADLMPGAAHKPHTSRPAPCPKTGERKSKSGHLRVGHAGAELKRNAASRGPDTGQASAGDTTSRFVSYLGVHAQEDDLDPDGLSQKKRMGLEKQAIDLIVKREPQLLQMSVNNRGFDLVENDGDGRTVRWIEVKAMTRSLENRPVGLSRAQFETAWEHGDRYWLYIVEHAASREEARIVRIQNPVGKARTFTFDHGWLSVAKINNVEETRPHEQSRQD